MSEELATLPDIPEEDLDELEQLNQALQAKKQKLARLSQLKKEIIEASGYIKKVQQDNGQQNRLGEENQGPDNRRESFLQPPTYIFDAASPLSQELQAVPWPLGYDQQCYLVMMDNQV